MHKTPATIRSCLSKWGLICLGFACCWAGEASAQFTSREAKLRAAYIYKFTKYVSWPETAFADNNRFVIGVVGKSQLDASLRQIAATKRAANRKIEFRTIRSATEAPTCHLIYVSSTATTNELSVLQGIPAEAPVLVIGEAYSPQQTTFGASFFVQNNLLNVNFYSNRLNTRGLGVRAQLLRLGVVHQIK